MSRKLFSSTLVISLALLLAAVGAYAAANKAPVVTAFDVAANSTSPVPVLTFTATDSDGTVTGYLIT